MSAPRDSDTSTRTPTGKRPEDQWKLGPPPDYSYGGRPPPSPYHPPPVSTGTPSRYGRYSGAPGRYMPGLLQPVVTNSFSADEREYVSHAGARPPFGLEQRIDREEHMMTDGEREDWPSPPPLRSLKNYEYPPDAAGLQQSHRTMHHPSIQRAYSLPPPYTATERDKLKRNYFHHSQASGDKSSQELPDDFMPPKRTKLEPRPAGTEVSLTARPPPGEGQAWCKRSGTWDGEEGRYKYSNQQYYGHPPPQPWPRYNQTPSPGSPKIFAAITPEAKMDYGTPPRPWRPMPQRFLGQSPSSAWSSPSARGGEGWHYPQDAAKMSHRVHHAASMDQSPGGSLGLMVEAAAAADSKDKKTFNFDKDVKNNSRVTVLPSGEEILLLALPQDRMSLSETLCVVRENIEIFKATQRDVDAPAPGRKHPVVVGQVGLRCVHCRHTIRCSDRVKRAVCYPSSIKRIYRTVIDMKLDHFSQCKYVPQSLKNHLDELKSVHTRSTGTTMQYFIRAAHSLGMFDGPSGVRINRPEATPDQQPPVQMVSVNTSVAEATDGVPKAIERTGSNTSSSVGTINGVTQRTDSMMSTESFDSPASRGASSKPPEYFCGKASLSLPEDKTSLSPLRCFLRKQVCAFSATEADIAARAPTTFSIIPGQVGIGCIHCLKQDPKGRSNRALCFPFSIARIYQSVADIQRFHIGECKMMPKDLKEKFNKLQHASSKGSKGLATRQYWIASARKIGLVDTPRGLRFGRDPSKPISSKALSLDILAQVAFSVTTANRQLVLPEDKPYIAEFLYVVMDQLQPCRFTEADRNKRRVKDVGCIGVECKHCAGQVDSRKFFWSTLSAVESNFVSVHTHMLECRMIPDSLKQKLTELKQLRKEQTAVLPSGSQKAFFRRVWERLHDDTGSSTSPSPSSDDSSGSVIQKQPSIEAREDDLDTTQTTAV